MTTLQMHRYWIIYSEFLRWLYCDL